jgi:hypothetical protein
LFICLFLFCKDSRLYCLVDLLSSLRLDLTVKILNGNNRNRQYQMQQDGKSLNI